MTSAFAPIAVIGHGCVFPPDSLDATTYWKNILSGRSGIGTTPPERWDWRPYHDEQRDSDEKTYCRLGGFLADYRFPRARAAAAGIAPEDLDALNRTQLMILDTALQALAMAGYDRDRLARTDLAMFVGNMLGDEGMMDASLGAHAREFLGHVERDVRIQALSVETRTAIGKDFLADVDRAFPPAADGNAAELFQVNLAKTVNRLLGASGPAVVVDAACAAGLAVIDVAVRYLQDGTHEAVLASGVLGNMNVTGNVCFAKIGGLSATHSSPLDAGADGLIPGEGAGTILLKRLADAVRDGDSIAGVIRGVATRCDGKGKAIYAPSSRGQVAAMRRALDLAGWEPEDVDHIETHATSTPTGDLVEVASLTQLFDGRPAGGRPVTLGSVKAQTGHTFSAAGMANLIKVLLGFEHSVVPPTHAVSEPPPGTGQSGSRFEVVTVARPWPTTDGQPSRVLSNAFGFGGVNTSICVERYAAAYHDPIADQGTKPAADIAPDAVGTEKRDVLDAPGAADRAAVAVVGIGLVAPHAARAADLDPRRPHELGTSGFPHGRWHPDAGELTDPDGSWRGGVISDLDFPWRRHRIPPNVVAELDRAQLLAVMAADQAMAAAPAVGTAERRDIGVFIGATCGLEAGLTRNLRVRAVEYARLLDAVAAFRELDAGVRAGVAADCVEAVRSHIPTTRENALPGYMDNIVAGRISNLFDLQGPGLVVDDDTCSFGAALDIALRYLEQGECSQALVGGVHANLAPEFTDAFRRWLAETGRPVDGFVPAEGAAFILVKALVDVGPDEHVYGVIRGARRGDAGGAVTEPDRQFSFGADGAMRFLDLVAARREGDAETELVMPQVAGGVGYRLRVGGRTAAVSEPVDSVADIEGVTAAAPMLTGDVPGPSSSCGYLVAASLEGLLLELALLAAGEAEFLPRLPQRADGEYRLGIVHTDSADLARKAERARLLLSRGRLGADAAAAVGAQP